MRKRISEKPVEGKPQGEFISLEWAANTAAEYLNLCQEFMKSCMLSDDPIERTKYYDSAMDALAHLITPCQMVGRLADEDFVLDAWFGHEIAQALEIVDDPSEE